MVRIKLLLIILNDGKIRKVRNILNKFSIKVKTSTFASGTASPSLLDYFGLVETKKEVFLAVIPDFLEMSILEKLDNEFKFNEPGGGVVFTIPISSSNKYLSDAFESKLMKKESVVMENKTNTKYHLIITIVLEGHLEKVMNAAKRVGAGGGTVIRGRGIGNKDVLQLFGFTVEPGRELVLNIVEEEIKNKVMEEITKEVGIKTGGRGVCISLPVDCAIGLEKK